MKISVIIPVFKAEKYISECIESVLNQSYTNFEIILIIDGSPDNSENICKRYAKEDTRVRIITRENQGVSSARNAGIINSTGEWILFLDADDKLYPNCLETCIKEVTYYNLDMLQFLHTQSKQYKRNKYNRVLNFKEFTRQKYNVCIGGSFFKSKIIKSKNIYFPKEIKLAEDQVFIMKFILNSQRFKILNSIYYYYRITPFSATSNINIDKIHKSCNYLINFKRKHPLISFHADNTILYFIYLIAVHSNSISEIILLYKNAQIKHCHWSNNSCKLFYFTACINIKLAISLARIITKLKRINANINSF